MSTRLLMRSVELKLYPVAVFQDRYNGTYSGGAWFAVANVNRDGRNAASFEDGPYGGRVEAARFWRDPPKWKAVGNTLQSMPTRR